MKIFTFFLDYLIVIKTLNIKYQIKKNYFNLFTWNNHFVNWQFEPQFGTERSKSFAHK